MTRRPFSTATPSMVVPTANVLSTEVTVPSDNEQNVPMSPPSVYQRGGNRHDRRRRQAENRRRRSAHNRWLSQKVAAAFWSVETPETMLLLAVFGHTHQAYMDDFRNEHPQLNYGERLSLLLENTAQVFGSDLSPEGLIACAGVLVSQLLCIARQRDLLSAYQVPVLLRGDMRRAVDDFLRCEPSDQQHRSTCASLATQLLDEMSKRGPELRAAIERDRRDVPVPNFLVTKMMLMAIRMQHLLSSPLSHQPKGTLLSETADTLWYCRALAFAEGLLKEEPAQ